MLHISPIELDIDMYIYLMQKMTQETGTRRLVIDSISSFEIGTNDKVKYTDYIWGLVNYFKTHGVTVLLTNETHNGEQITSFTKYGISFMADNLLLLQYIEQRAEITRYLRIVKMRGSSHSNKMKELRFDNNQVTLV